MIGPKKNRSRIHFIVEAVTIAIIFFVAFAVGLGMMQYIYGYDFNLTSGPYSEVMNATNNASEYALNQSNVTQ